MHQMPTEITVFRYTNMILKLMIRILVLVPFLPVFNKYIEDITYMPARGYKFYLRVFNSISHK